MAICTFVAAKPLILLLAGEQFADSVGLLQVLIWVIVLSFVSQQFRFFLTAVNLRHYFVGIVAIVLGTKIALQLVLVPLWGGYGACLEACQLAGQAWAQSIGTGRETSEKFPSIAWLAT